jgi:predicted acetyltransferase
VVEIRVIEPEELRDYRNAINFGFGENPETDDDALERFRAITTIETSTVAVDRGHIVATFGSYDLDLTVPGGARVPMAGTTHVTVHPTHRRRGLLTKMMRMHLDQAVERGQPMAGLWASDERIYGRFGYGPAITGHQLTVPADTVELTDLDPGITVHPLSMAEAKERLPSIYERQLATAAAGRLVRSDAWWNSRRFFEATPEERGPQRRYVVAERDGQEVGYVIFKQISPDDWSEGTTDIKELIAADDQVRRSLWNFVTNVDLFRKVNWWNAPIDEPVLIEAERFRRITRSVMESLWVRPLDIPALLTTRLYERDGAVTVGVTDNFGPTSGTYRIEVVAGAVSVEPTTAAPEVTLAVEELGRLFLGGGSAVALQRAGLIAGDPGPVGTLHDLFATRVQPHMPEVF